MSAIGDHLWQSTLFAVVAGLLTLALRKNSARVRHGVWLAASLKFFVPVFAIVAAGSHMAWRTAPVAVPSGFSVAVEAVSEPFVAAVGSRNLPPEADTTGLVFMVIWGCGVIGIACSWWIRWRRIRAAVQARTVLAPGVFGIFRPALVLPEGISERLSPAQLKAVIAHELCHVRHRDNLVAAIHMCVETVFWFHPLVWWMGKRMAAERERACDEEVLRLGTDARVYAEGILTVCALCVESPAVCMSSVTGADLKKRIQDIVDGRAMVELSCARKAALAAAGMTCVAVPFVIGVWNAPLLRGQDGASVAVMAPTGVKFRSVSIERCKGYVGGAIESPAPGRLVANCVTATSLIYNAYGGAVPLSGDPTWVGSGNHRYRIEARAESSVSLATMLQALLADRFGLRMRRVTRESPMYALSVAKSGAKLQPSKEQSCTGAWPAGFPVPAALRGACVTLPELGRQGSKPYMTLQAKAIGMEGFCELLGGPSGRPVIDKTGIGGKYDFDLVFAGDKTPAVLAPLYPSLFSVVEQKLGLKLTPFTGRRDFIVVDRIEKPVQE